MVMCILKLDLIGLFVFKILSKNSILPSIKGRNSVANLPKFELIQAFMHVFVTCNNEEDPIKNIKALDLMVSEKKIFLRFPIVSLREMMSPGAWLI